MRTIKIGIQNLHHDEILTLQELFQDSNVKLYCWLANQYDANEIQSCDFLVLFARRHWEYLKFDIPYLLILADYVTDQKAVNISMSRSLGLFGYKYTPNNLFRGYLCGSTELLRAVQRQNIPAIFYPKKYPFAEAFATLSANSQKTDSRDIVTLINKYEKTASFYKWNKPENSYKAYRYIASNSTQFKFTHYGAPGNQISFEDSLRVQFNARYTIHIKYWGHVCNAVVKSLALGTPVIMDEATFIKGRYEAYLRHGENGMVVKNKEEIVAYLNSLNENDQWRQLKRVCLNEAERWHFPYLKEQKDGWIRLLNRDNPINAV